MRYAPPGRMWYYVLWKVSPLWPFWWGGKRLFHCTWLLHGLCMRYTIFPLERLLATWGIQCDSGWRWEVELDNRCGRVHTGALPIVLEEYERFLCLFLLWIFKLCSIFNGYGIPIVTEYLLLCKSNILWKLHLQRDTCFTLEEEFASITKTD